MNGTPRLRSAFPNTPKPDPRHRRASNHDRTSSSLLASSPLAKPIRVLAAHSKKPEERLIPFDVVDAPTQRFYIVSAYILLWAWRLYNAYYITSDLDSSWYFLQWSGFDAAFFIVLSWLQIPWLEFSITTSTVLWIFHTIANAFLMFKIPIPILFWLGSLTKVFYDRELSISEQMVKPANILQNSSIILGRQIIHILPEGSAILNPEKLSFCIDTNTPYVDLPLQINQTSPILIDLMRYDLAGGVDEHIEIGNKQARALKKEADKGHPKTDSSTPRLLRYRVNKTGLYRLERVIDESKLEVRRRSHDIAVVDCPKALVTSSAEHGCTNDFSKTSIGVNGVPPFRVKYSKRINREQFSSIVQSIQAPQLQDGLTSDGTVATTSDPSRPPMGRIQSASVSFDINEILNQNGTWTYVVEDVEDGLGNTVVYDTTSEKDMVKARRASSLTVHQRPILDLVNCNSEKPLRVAKEDNVALPVRIRPIGQYPASDWPMKLKYTFTPETDGDVPIIEDIVHELSNGKEASRPRISRAGRYSLDSIESQFCLGEVVEPSSCPLYNPPKPAVALNVENLFDKCAGNPIGMTVNLDFTGTPPFKVRYSVEHNGKVTPKVQTFDSLRGQIEFKEKAAGSYAYRFLGVGDDVYSDVSLKELNREQEMHFKQDIKPPSTAAFADGKKLQEICFGETASLPVRFSGEGPWDLEYEIVHNGKRKKHSKHSEEDFNFVEMPEQPEGGDYTIVLTGVEDRLKCKTTLQEQRSIRVRPEQPQAAFGDIDGKRIVRALEGKTVSLPLRLRGNAPWTVQIKNLDDGSRATEQTFKHPNDIFHVNRPGTYEIILPSDDSSLSIALTGNPPFRLKYSQKYEPARGASAISNKPLSVAGGVATINLDTSKAGEYTYTFNELSDDRYTHNSRHFHDIAVKQHIHGLPTAKFTSPGKTYGYCKDDPSFDTTNPETESIPITLTGTPPFSLEIAILHHGVSTKPEIIRVRDITSTSYAWPLSRSSLDIGSHNVQIRGIKDAHNCQNFLESDSSAVRIAVSSPPTIIPLESQTDYCVGEHVSFSLSGQAPFEVFYNFNKKERKAKISSGSEFRRIAESPGEFTITGVSDSAMGRGSSPGKSCRARKDITKFIHPYPSVKISHGRTLVSDIHEGGEVEILFEFTGTPPFEFTYTRSENVGVKGKGAGSRAKVLETRHDTSSEFSKRVRASDEGTYEVVAIKDRYCAYARDSQGSGGGGGGKGQKLLQY
ncbi:Nucleoporin [Cyphellophora attinorum]|uniref:Nucleoporin n=1 Tax=Cyphellophora attinorum TaxID=1664694 RepID=A0A0N1HGA2_9EURO|nr:Nucleoporin [Phialophora attinorum]KPI44533.1 Nucleoporin [Phialophora attinorum]